MQIEIISFTTQGNRQAEKIRKVMEYYGEVQLTDGTHMEISLQQWCQNVFSKAQLMIFVGAAGIAVRAVAPFVKDKFTDPAVLVVDELGKFVIPILSGHIGRANEYAAFLAEQISAIAVITTATDLNGKFAVDVFAEKNQLVIRERKWAKEISVAILREEKVFFSCEGDVFGNVPKELTQLIETREEEQETGNSRRISVGIHWGDHLIPKAVTLGIGCRKGKSAEEIEEFVSAQLEKQKIALESVACIASVDRKKEEPGLLAFCKKYDVSFQTFSVEELQQMEGSFAGSDFVKETIGVENVCERAAICAQKEEKAHIILPKTAENGMTLAIAEREWSVTFE